MAKRKTSAKKLKSSSVGRSVKAEDFSSIWKTLILFNLALSAFSGWMLYSQNKSIMETLKTSVPLAVPELSGQTATVVNPFTGHFITVGSFTPVASLLGVLTLIGVYFFLRETM